MSLRVELLENGHFVEKKKRRRRSGKKLLLDPQMNFDNYHEDGTNILEEIELVLGTKKVIEDNHSIWDKTDILCNSPPKNAFTTMLATSMPNEAQNLAVTSNANNLNDILDNMVNVCAATTASPLFSVQNYELMPVTSPFLKPGIYKKIPDYIESESISHSNSQHRKTIVDNVFLSAQQSRGRIVPFGAFSELYMHDEGHFLTEAQTPALHAVTTEIKPTSNGTDGTNAHEELNDVKNMTTMLADVHADNTSSGSKCNNVNNFLFTVDNNSEQNIKSNLAEANVLKHTYNNEKNENKTKLQLSIKYEQSAGGEITAELKNTQELPLSSIKIAGKGTPTSEKRASKQNGTNIGNSCKVASDIPNDIDLAQWNALSKLAYNIQQLSQQDHIVIDRKRSEIIRTEHGTNQKTIYRIPALKSLNLQVNSHKSATAIISSATNKNPIKIKLGRPRKNTLETAEIKPKTQIKPKETEVSKMHLNKTEEILSKTPELRTRSGRVVKCTKPSIVSMVSESINDNQSTDELRSYLNDLRDNDFRCNPKILPPPPLPAATADCMSITEDDTAAVVPLTTKATAKRRVPPESICPTCKKIFLGRRLQRHFAQYPDHMNMHVFQRIPSPAPPANTQTIPTQSVGNMSLFRFLVSKLQRCNLNEDQRADLFLSELNDLAAQLQMRSSRLIRNTSGLHFVTAHTSRLLGIPEGQYALDLSAIMTPELEEPECTEAFASTIFPSQSLDYSALSVSIDETLTDEAVQKLNLSAGGKLFPPSEESLLSNVEGIKRFSRTNLIPHEKKINGSSTIEAVNKLIPQYDICDNAMEAVNMKETKSQTLPAAQLSIPVDFFQFNNNN